MVQALQDKVRPLAKAATMVPSVAVRADGWAGLTALARNLPSLIQVACPAFLCNLSLLVHVAWPAFMSPVARAVAQAGQACAAYLNLRGAVRPVMQCAVAGQHIGGELSSTAAPALPSAITPRLAT